MDNRTNKSISEFIAAIAKNDKRLVKAVLFGSYAKELDNEESDIDLALVINNLDDKEKFDLQVQLLLMASKFDSRIEPHPISANESIENSPFYDEILKTGIEIEVQEPGSWYEKKEIK